MAGKPRFDIVIPVYPGVDLLDVTAPWEIFNWMKAKWKAKEVSIQLAAARKHSMVTRDGFQIQPDVSFAECRRLGRQFHLLWVPGGNVPDLRRTMNDPVFLRFLREQSAHAEWVTSVCEGALLLAAASLLNGYKATTHWAFLPCFESYPEIVVAPGTPRFVVDRNRVTGGGISSGLDEALELVRLIAGESVAEEVQVSTQYFPCPPVHGKLPKPDGCPL